MSWWKRGRVARAEDLHIMPGELQVWVPDDGSDRLLFGVDVLDDDGGGRYTVLHDRDQVCSLVRQLELWLGGSCDDGS